MISGDFCPYCQILLETIEPDNPDDVNPNGGRYEEYLYCSKCENTFEIKND